MRYAAVIFAFIIVILLSGCGSTVITRSPDGTTTEIKAGFGNKIQAPPVIVEPSAPIVEAGERLGRQAIDKATDRMVEKAIEAVNKPSSAEKLEPP